jgi:hypothetical protein
MRVAILSESSADEAAIRILAEGVLGCTIVPVETALRSRGWPGVLNILATTIKFLHYRTDAEGLIVVADSNHTSLQAPAEENRLLTLRRTAENTVSNLGRVAAKPTLLVAIGVASPAIEGWLLCHRHQEISEAAWEKGLVESCDPYSRPELKRRSYGVERPTLGLETAKMVEAANELRGRVSEIENRFPVGFGSLATQLRAWRRVG